MSLLSIFCVVLLAVFIGLKCAKVITWSWLWVLSPIWIPLVLVIIFVVLSFLREALDDFFEN